MMVALFVYAYAIVVRSSRAIERSCREDIAVRVIAANQHPQVLAPQHRRGNRLTEKRRTDTLTEPTRGRTATSTTRPFRDSLTRKGEQALSRRRATQGHARTADVTLPLDSVKAGDAGQCGIG
jgi:hypothetical protein